MKVLLDSIIFSLQKQGGISIYWSELLTRFSNNNNFDYTVRIYSNNQNENINKIIHLNQSKSFIVKKYNNLLPINLLRFFPLFFFKKEKQIFHSSYLNTTLSFRKTINILTIHDLGYERKLTQSGLKRFINILFKYFALKNADGIICISNFTKNELLNFYPFCNKKRIKVIYNGVSEGFYPLESNAPRIIKNKYVLFVGMRYDYKKFHLLVNALEKRNDVFLVIVGGGKLLNAEQSLLNLKILNRYVHFESANTDELNNLYNFAFSLVYPSIYEGFGIPIVEAMACGCPFIAFNNASIPEIASNAGLILDDKTSEGILIALNKFNDEKFRQEKIKIGLLISKTYSWNKCFNETLSFYKELYSDYNKNKQI